MGSNLERVACPAHAFPPRPPGMYLLGYDASFRAHDCVCRHGVRSPVLEGAFGLPRISVILSGTFHARTSAGECLLGPGALLFGNASTNYAFRHVDNGGDRSLVFEYDPGVFEEVNDAMAVRGARFRRVPPSHR